ncbi:MAG TPA: hypothetical protein VFA25_00415 [Actinomycetota bacterium]|nr:hypothetical protein [Actinomycetota bacterium]
MSDTLVRDVPKPIEVGCQMDALRRFCRDCVWSGRIRPGGMGAGTPPMTGIGRAIFHPIQDGRWLVGDFEQDQYLEDGSFVLTWELHWVCGWSPKDGEYRATMVDVYGNADVYRGHIDGDRLVFESMPDSHVRLRLTWDASDPLEMKWRNEMEMPDGSWFLIEEYPIVPI